MLHKILRQFTFKHRGLFEKLTTPPTEEQRIGERNQRYINKVFVVAILALLCLGIWKMVELFIE